MRFTRVVTWILLAIGAVASVLAGLAMARGGIGWDAPVDAQAVAQVQALPADATLQQAYDAVFWTSEFYGLLVSQLADGAHALITGSSTALDAGNLVTYRWQGGVTIVLAVAGAAALGLAVSRALRSPLAGAFAWALTMTTPLYFGMSHVDFKDIPVAAGLTMLSAGLIISRVAQSQLGRWAGGTSLMLAGLCIALGSRVGGWPLIVVVVVSSLLVFAIQDLRRRRFAGLVAPAVGALIAGVGTVAFLWLTNPFARINLPQWLYDSYTVMRAYPMDLTIRAGGQDFSTTDLPWWYIPGWLGAQLPLLTIVALTWAAVAVVATLFGARWSVPRGDLVRMAPLFAQGVLLPLGIAVTGAVVYDGLRHVLFMIPALAGITAIGVAALERGAWRRPARAQILAAGASLLVVVASGWATVRWIPYSYAFINPISGWDHSARNWELDYWGVSAMEGLRRLQEAGLSPVAVDPTASTADIVGAVWPDQAKKEAPDGYGYYVFKRWDASIGACEPLFTIERDGQVLGQGARCTRWDR